MQFRLPDISDGLPLVYVKMSVASSPAFKDRPLSLTRSASATLPSLPFDGSISVRSGFILLANCTLNHPQPPFEWCKQWWLLQWGYFNSEKLGWAEKCLAAKPSLRDICVGKIHSFSKLWMSSYEPVPWDWYPPPPCCTCETTHSKHKHSTSSCVCKEKKCLGI